MLVDYAILDGKIKGSTENESSMEALFQAMDASLVCDYLNENQTENGTIYTLCGTDAMPDSSLHFRLLPHYFFPVRLLGRAGDFLWDIGQSWTENGEVLEIAGEKEKNRKLLEIFGKMG